MKKIAIGTLAVGAAAAFAAMGAGTAGAAVAEGTYNLCLETQYGSSAETKCSPYEVKGTDLIGPNGEPLAITSTANGGYVEFGPLGRGTITSNGDGTYTLTNLVLGIPTATSTMTPA